MQSDGTRGMTIEGKGLDRPSFLPRQLECWKFYIDPESETFSNAYRSALRAGYSDHSASQVTDQAWFKARLKKLTMLVEAEDVLVGMMQMDEQDDVFFEGSPTGHKARNSTIVKIKQDTAKFITERLGKKEWSQHRDVDVTTGGEKLTQADTVALLEGIACDEPKE